MESVGGGAGQDGGERLRRRLTKAATEARANHRASGRSGAGRAHSGGAPTLRLSLLAVALGTIEAKRAEVVQVFFVVGFNYKGGLQHEGGQS